MALARTDFHPDLVGGRFIPSLNFGPRSSRFMRGQKPRPVDPGPDVTVREHLVPSAFHGFDATFARTPVAAAFWREQTRALAAAGIGGAR